MAAAGEWYRGQGPYYYESSSMPHPAYYEEDPRAYGAPPPPRSPSYHRGGAPPPAAYHPPGPNGPPPPFRGDYWYEQGPMPPQRGTPPRPPPPGGAWYPGPPPPHRGPLFDEEVPPEAHYSPPVDWPQPPKDRDLKRHRASKEEVREASKPEPHDSKEDSQEDTDDDRKQEAKDDEDAEQDAKGDKKKKGDPLSLLAKVSSRMAPPKDRKKKEESSPGRKNTENQPPKDNEDEPEDAKQTSPPRGNGPRVSPIISPRASRRPQHPPKPITPTVSYYGTEGFEHPRSVRPYYPPRGYGPPSSSRGGRYHGGPPPSYYHRESWPHEPTPAVVERGGSGSFDSVDSFGEPIRFNPSWGYYSEGPPPPPGYGPEYSPQWQQRQQGPPPAGPPPPPPEHGRPPYPPRWGYTNQGPPPPTDRRVGPPPPRPREGGPPMRPGYEEGMPPMGYSPYAYVQQPHGAEKTILRKKFSWKHYPELERFLIANRDEYLKHSSKNYTLEQKQYNNWLTERLIEVAGEHNYVFDPEAFNFVAIRDRVRCYYKSYVQTARKRGLPLPGDLDKSKKIKTSHDGDKHDDSGTQVDEQDEERDDKTEGKEGESAEQEDDSGNERAEDD